METMKIEEEEGVNEMKGWTRGCLRNRQIYSNVRSIDVRLPHVDKLSMGLSVR